MRLKSINIRLIFFILFSFYFFLRISEISDWNNETLNLENRFFIIFLILLIATICFFKKSFEKKDVIFLYPIILLILSKNYLFAISLIFLIFMSKAFNFFLQYYQRNKFRNIISIIFILLFIFYPLIKNFDHPSIFFTSYWSSIRFGLGYFHPKEQALALFFLFFVLTEVHKDYRLLGYVFFFILILITNSRNVTIVFLIYTILNLYKSLNKKDKDLMIKFIKFCTFPIIMIFLYLNKDLLNYEFINVLSSRRLEIITLIFNESLPSSFSVDNSYLLMSRENIIFFYLFLPWIFFMVFKFELYKLDRLDQFKILLICLLSFSYFDLGLFSSTNLLSLICFSKYYNREKLNV